jgi:SAM-dependent methyltransferase
LSRCTVCGSEATTVVCSASEIAVHQRFLQRFHRRRLKRTKRRTLADRAEFTQDDVTAIVECGGCGHVFRARRPDANDAVETYAEDTYGAERLAALFESQLEQFRRKLPRLRALLTARAPRIAEVGSFVGGFLAAAGEAGWDAVGIDPGEEVVAFCRGRGLRVERATAPEAAIAAGSMDAVVIWNTFDQLPDPRPTLAAARRWLRPTGVLALRVPNGRAFRAAIAAARDHAAVGRYPIFTALAWNNLLSFPYLQGYTPASLDRLLTESGAHRVRYEPDVLTRLADEHTKAWAAAEEWLSKSAWRAVARFDPHHAPWFDAYYEWRPNQNHGSHRSGPV